MLPLRPSCQKTFLLAGWVALHLAAAAPEAPAVFTPQDAVRAEWERVPPALTPGALAALSPADRARLELTLKRIGAPGAAPLLPSWLENPTAAVWEARALQARTPEDRVTALHFLNRLKSPKALTALDGLTAADAATWPAALHLEGPLASARINGCEPSPDLTAFLGALRKVGKADPVRAHAALIRLRMAGKEKGEADLPDASNLADLDAWNRGPWDLREKRHLALLAGAVAAPFNPGPGQRLLEGLPGKPLPDFGPTLIQALTSDAILIRAAALEYCQKLPSLEPDVLAQVKKDALKNFGGPLCGPFLAVLRKHAPADADHYGHFLLGMDDPLALGAALDDLPQAPADLESLVKRLWKTSQYDAVQTFLPSLERWKLPIDQRKALLARFLGHPCWTARLDAYNLLAKLDPATPWPTAPKVSFQEESLLNEALRLAKAGKPVRMAITFEGNRRIVLKLDPSNAPINVANLVLLTRQGFFNGLAVPRVVPDFVVQMGSPCDTMDGGPGYTVRCEDSLAWYGPGSVGMALSGKDTGGSQFFITTNAAPHLTGRYTRVGEVEDPGYALPILDGLELGVRMVKVEIL
jgi:cyclophilin family peptidyl-prolyl cis-trans isomerase